MIGPSVLIVAPVERILESPLLVGSLVYCSVLRLEHITDRKHFYFILVNVLFFYDFVIIILLCSVEKNYQF